MVHAQGRHVLHHGLNVCCEQHAALRGVHPGALLLSMVGALYVLDLAMIRILAGLGPVSRPAQALIDHAGGNIAMASAEVVGSFAFLAFGSVALYRYLTR